MKSIIIFILFFSFLWAEESLEPSAFELQSGMTKKEVRDIKETAESQSNKIFELENRIKQLEISLDGLKSISEGQSNSIKDIYNKTISNEEKSADNATKSEITALQEQVSNNMKNIQTLTDSLKNISTSVEEIHKILNDELKKDIKELDESKTPPDDKKDSPAQDNTTENDTQKDTNQATFDKDITRRGDIFKEARTLTYAKKFSDAIARYNWFIEIDYKKAESNYMLGNIAYENNRYNDAVFYYKESAVLDDKASYMPRLMLNSANSFRVLKDTENAKKFYNSLISQFPDSNEAKEATKQLNKLK